MSKTKCMSYFAGAGAGIGGNVGKKFAKEGYHTHFGCRRRYWRRRSNEEGLNRLVNDINEAGGSAAGRMDKCDRR